MKKLIQKLSLIIYNCFYKKQDFKAKKEFVKLNKKVLSGSICGEKIHTTGSATLCIKNASKKETQELNEKIKNIVKKCQYNPYELFKYIKGAKTPIYQVKNASKFLAKINEKEGLIFPKKGYKAFYLNLILNKKIKFETSEMFIVEKNEVNPYNFLYQFYAWYGYKMGLKGYELETQEYYKHVFEIYNSGKINELSFDEVLALKSAIQRDCEAIEFVKETVKQYSASKKNLEKIKQGKAIKV